MRLMFLLPVLLASAASGTVQADEPLDLVPGEYMLVWNGKPFPDVPPPEAGPTAIDAIIATIPRMAGERMDRGARLGLRIIQCCALMIRYPHCVTMLDASAIKAGVHPDSRRVDKLRLALIVQTAGKAGPFLNIIQNAADEQTNTEHARIDVKQAGRWSYSELADQRLPEWYVVAWGEIDGFFVLTLGNDVWPEIAAVAAGDKPSLAQDPWMQKHRGAPGREALIEIIANARRMRERLDPLVNNWISDFFAVWDAQTMQRSHWALGLRDRALYCIATFELQAEDGPAETVRHVYADAADREPRVMSLIPNGSRYAIYRIPTSDVIVKLIRSMFVWQSEESVTRATRLWVRIQKEHGFDAHADILDQLGDVAILHNFPPHPLKLPVFFTTLVEIKGDSQQVRKSIDVMCRAWQAGLEREADRLNVPDPLRLNRDSDGVWYFPLGPFLNGLAWKVADGYLVISWSPDALREYLAEAGPRLGKP